MQRKLKLAVDIEEEEEEEGEQLEIHHQLLHRQAAAATPGPMELSVKCEVLKHV